MRAYVFVCVWGGGGVALFPLPLISHTNLTSLRVDQHRSEHDAAYAKLRGQLRETKLKLCKYELECTW